MSFWHPARLIATWFGVGHLPGAPGTWASLAALPFAFVIQFYGGPGVLMLAIVLLIPISVWAAQRAEEHFGDDDPGQIVVDEIVGQWLTVLFLPASIGLYLIGFVVFRVFDIFKPWPVDHFDKHGRGGMGVVQDDIAAGLYGLMVLQGGLYAVGSLWPSAT